MPERLKPLEIEELEHIHFERIRYYFLDNFQEILNGLQSRLEIKNDWYPQFIATKSNTASDLEMGAERIFHYIFGQGMRSPNSTPIGADLLYETHDAFIHIDVKTISDSNWNDYKGKIVVEPNQTSYPLSSRGLEPNLPTHYSKTFIREGREFKKPCLTYFIYVLHKHASEQIYSILLICMPNGELFNMYGKNILQAGKTKHNIRYAFKVEPKFKLLSEKRQEELFRIGFLLKSKKYSQEDLTGISEYQISVWREL